MTILLGFALISFASRAGRGAPNLLAIQVDSTLQKDGRGGVAVFSHMKEVRGVPALMLGPYVPAWHGFSVVRNGVLYSLSVRAFIKKASLRPGLMSAYGVSPDGKYFVSIDGESQRLDILSITSGGEHRFLALADLPGQPIPCRTYLQTYRVSFDPRSLHAFVAVPKSGPTSEGSYSQAQTLMLDLHTLKAAIVNPAEPIGFIAGHLATLDRLHSRVNLGDKLVANVKDSDFLTTDDDSLIALRKDYGKRKVVVYDTSGGGATHHDFNLDLDARDVILGFAVALSGRQSALPQTPRAKAMPTGPFYSRTGG